MKKIIIFVIFLILTLVYSITNHFIGTSKISVKFLSDEQKKIIKKYFFPYKLITLQEQEIQELEDNLKKKDHFFFEMELDFKRSLGDIQLIREDNTKLSNDKNFIKYKLANGFTSSVYGMRPGGYLDFHKNNLLILSARGILAFTKNIEDSKKFTQIDNNIDTFIGLKQFKKDPVFSLRDIFVHKNKVYVSFIEEIKEDCWNTSVIHGEMNYKNIIFKKLFSSEQCNHSKINDGGFTANSSGGRIVGFDENHILLSVGDYIQRYRAQDIESINGKILKINVGNGIHEIISMGHRNPQGLFFDKKNNIILETEHGPRGGDEINIIEISKLIKNEPFNYGWAIASYGEHYGGNTKKNEEKYKKYPLLKSHKENGFVEPIKYFVPSIGISEITKIGKNKYVTSSMGSKRPGDKSLYFFELNEKKKLVNLQKIKVNQRVRDLKFKDEKLYLFLEETATIGIISLK